jgi:hypothetical protein
MSYSSERGWSGTKARKRRYESTERAIAVREAYRTSTPGIISRLRHRINYNANRRMAHGTRTP